MAKLTIIRISSALGASLTLLVGAEMRFDTVPLADGGTTPRLTLATSDVSVSVLPELGGKIISLTDRTGGEFLSRSRKPYIVRKSGMTYGDSEFDGIDECFPTVGACIYPTAPWAGVAIPEHGELWSQAWTVIPSAHHDVIVLEARGATLPYRFRRSITVAEATVTLDYLVSNDGDAPLPYLYAFHPLLRGEKGGGLEWPAEQPLTVAYSHRDSLGAGGLKTTWGALMRDGKPLRDQQFTPDSTRYYKYIVTPLTTGHAVMHRADRATMTLGWDIASQPCLAVWCWEGEVPGINHLAPEPTTAPVDTLAAAIAVGQAPFIPAHGFVQWHISLTVQPVSK